MKLTQDAKLLAAVLLVGAAGLWWITRQGVAKSLATGAVKAAEEVAVGTVVGIGNALGIPETSAQKCQTALANRNWWDASFYCPADTYAKASAGAFGDQAVEAVQSAGELVGIPRTNQTQCQQDLAAGRWLAASFSCPAGTFISAGAGAVFGSTALTDAQAADARNAFAATDPRRVDL